MRHLVGSLVVSVGLLSSSCLSLPTAADAHVSYATVPSMWPDAATCLNNKSPAVVKEVLDGSLRTVVIAGGPSPISDVDWEHYSPSLGNTKNSDRHVLFTSSCFVRSPGLPANCVGDACRHVVDLDGHTIACPVVAPAHPQRLPTANSRSSSPRSATRCTSPATSSS